MLVSLVVIVVRFLRIFTVATLDERLRRRFRQAAEPVGWQEMTIASWAGMRRVVTLAAALALPAEFPQRSRLTFIRRHHRHPAASGAHFANARQET
jgi:CPA1 family monovalent cation:H+ antiporter